MLIKLKSLGLRSDLIFLKLDGEVLDRGDYFVVKTHSNPTYFWGNFLIFKSPPEKGDLPKWRQIFKSEFTDPKIYHVTFSWDAPQGESGDVSEFLQAGFTFESSIVLEAQAVVKPPKFNEEIKVRPLESDRDWEEALQIQLKTSSDNPDLTLKQLEEFYRKQMIRYRQMKDKHMGQWFGAFLGEKMVAGLGIFHESELGRFQLVSTHPDYRRLGICGTLVYHSAQYALKNLGIKTLVMISDAHYHAAKIYESVGFKPTEKIHGLCWWDKTRT